MSVCIVLDLLCIVFIPHPHHLSTHPTPSHTHSGVPPDSSGSVRLHHQPSRDSVLLLHLGTEQTTHSLHSSCDPRVQSSATGAGQPPRLLFPL